MNILAINGSPRPKGNTSLMLEAIGRGVKEYNIPFVEVNALDLNLEYCTGCLRCNLIKRCAIKNDDWPNLSKKILAADKLIFGSPIYFHHFTAPLKKIIDRFRSFLHVQMTETGLIHTPWHNWNKHFILVLSLGNQVNKDTLPVIQLMEFMTQTLGPQNQLTVIIGLGLGKVQQIIMNKDQLRNFYSKIQMPENLVEFHHKRNQNILKTCYELGKSFCSPEHR